MSMDSKSFKAEVPRKLSALLQRLDALDVVIAIYMLRDIHADVDLLGQSAESLAENGLEVQPCVYRNDMQAAQGDDGSRGA